MEDTTPTQEELQQIWDDEAKQLDAGDTPASEPMAAAVAEPEPLPQENDPIDPEPAASPTENPVDPLDEIRVRLHELETLKATNQQLLHQVKSAEGRMAAIQREYEQSRRAAAQLAPDAQPTQAQVNQAAQTPAKWAALKEDFPEWGEAVEELLHTKLTQVNPAQTFTPDDVARIVQQNADAVRFEMMQKLEEVRVDAKHDNWRNEVNTTEFAQWLAVQPIEVKQLTQSPYASDAIALLDLYQTAKAKPVAHIRQEREQRLAAAATTRPGTTKPAKTLDGMSPAELWEYEARQREKTRLERGF